MTHPCHLDRTLGYRVTSRHVEGCTDPRTHDGCEPCGERHCVVDGYTHLDISHPLTCPRCLSAIRKDLADIRWACRHLRWQAARGENYRTAAAPIPGGDAMVLISPHARHADAIDPDPKVHRDTDLRTPLEVLLTWDHQVRSWLGHQLPARPSVRGTTAYLEDHLQRWAQDTTGRAPDWPAFATEVGELRRLLERVLHDEQTPELGVACFECGDRLVRRWGDAKPCGHRTPARDLVRVWTHVLGYPEALTAADHLEAALPCGACDQGGIADPSAGQSWECPGCRKEYTPGEYASAVRRDLLERGPDGDGWTHVNMAAEAASTLTGYFIAPATVRRWMDRGQVVSCCRWKRGEQWGLRLVFWPSVAEVASAAAERHARALAERMELERQEQALRAAVDAGEDVAAAGRRLRIHAKRVARFVAKWAGESGEAG